MIRYRKWEVRSAGGLKITTKDGWFLLGILPLYIRTWNA